MIFFLERTNISISSGSFEDTKRWAFAALLPRFSFSPLPLGLFLLLMECTGLASFLHIASLLPLVTDADLVVIPCLCEVPHPLDGLKIVTNESKNNNNESFGQWAHFFRKILEEFWRCCMLEVGN